MDIKDLCAEYSRRVGNEIDFSDLIYDQGFKQMRSGIISNPIGALDLLYQSKNAINKMKITYLVDLFDSFMAHFVCLKEGLIYEDFYDDRLIKEILRGDREQWANHCLGHTNLNTSISFMNLRFSIFVLKNRYSIEYPSYFSDLVLELGSLRNCLVHNNGFINKKDNGSAPFKNTLAKTIEYLYPNCNTPPERIDINNKKYLKLVIYDVRDFIAYCGGIIKRTNPINN